MTNMHALAVSAKGVINIWIYLRTESSASISGYLVQMWLQFLDSAQDVALLGYFFDDPGPHIGIIIN